MSKHLNIGFIAIIILNSLTGHFYYLVGKNVRYVPSLNYSNKLSETVRQLLHFLLFNQGELLFGENRVLQPKRVTSLLSFKRSPPATLPRQKSWNVGRESVHIDLIEKRLGLLFQVSQKQLGYSHI